MTYRIYYNNATDPQHWSVDEGTPETEICVMGCHFDMVSGQSRQADDMTTDAQPKVWLEVSGFLRIHGGMATFSSYR